MSGTYENPIYSKVKAAADLVANRLVGYDGNYAVTNAPALGITESSISNGSYGTVCKGGTFLLEVSGTIAAGDELTAGTDGVGTASAAGNYIHAIAIGSGTDDLIEVEPVKYQRN